MHQREKKPCIAKNVITMKSINMELNIVEKKQCKQCQISFDITDKDLEFYEKVSPVFDGKRYGIPSPSLCHSCRSQRRLSFWNERNLYKRVCDASGKLIVSIYTPDKNYKVYDQDIWWGDSWEPLDYWRDFDFNKSFFSQFESLIQDVPRYNLYNFDNENSQYVQYLPHSKNCYLVFWWWYCNDCYYGGTLMESNDSIDCLYISKSDICYQWVDLDNCNNCFFSLYARNCSFSWFLEDCIWCTNCFGCSWLKNKSYHIFNKEVSKQEYESFLEKAKQNIWAYKDWRDQIENYITFDGTVVENSENYTGNYIYNSKNIINASQSWDSEDISHSTRFAEMKDSMDIYGSAKWSLLYEAFCCDYGYRLLFSYDSEHCKDSFFLDHCYHSSNLFACAWLRNAEYCIFNKQYTKQQYEQLVPKIIEHMQTSGEWWEFFPSSLSPFGYNETIASQYFSLSKDQAWKRGYKWNDYETPFPKVDKVIPASKLPEKIDDIPDDILNWAIECEITKKPFRIIKPELEFYRKHSLPIPRRHPEQRHLDRMQLRNITI